MPRLNPNAPFRLSARVAAAADEDMRVWYAQYVRRALEHTSNLMLDEYGIDGPDLWDLLAPEEQDLLRAIRAEQQAQAAAAKERAARPLIDAWRESGRTG